MATKKKRCKKRKLIVHPRFFLVLALLVLALGVLILLIVSILSGGKSDQTEQIQSTEGQKKTGIFQIFVKETPTPTPSPSPTPSPEPTPSPTPKPTPHYVESSNPERYGYVPHLEVDGKEINAGSYTRPEKIVFPDASEYNALNGILTFRGNNFRNLSASSELNLTEYKLTEVTKVAPEFLVTTTVVLNNDGRDVDDMLREMEQLAKQAVEKVAPLEKDPWMLVTQIGEYGIWARIMLPLSLWHRPISRQL